MTDVAGRPLVRHVGRVYDSVRWEGFELRPDDIIVTTPPKCGTTWSQMICALLVLQTPDLPDLLSNLSPWLDMLTRSRKETVAILEAQEHRRFMKTHTPRSGLPLRDGVTYICVGRDPRDVALSMDDHRANMDLAAFQAACRAAAEIDGLPAPSFGAPPPTLTMSSEERFWHWVEDDTPPTEAASSLLRTLTHVQSFWDVRDDPSVVLLHYHDLKTDLEGQMRALATRLAIDVPDDAWPALVQAATFDDMRRNADKTVPSSGGEIWRDRTKFFNRARTGEWRELLDADGLRRYEARVSALVPPDLSAWLHRSA